MYIEVPGRNSSTDRHSTSFTSSKVSTSDVKSESTITSLTIKPASCALTWKNFGAKNYRF